MMSPDLRVLSGVDGFRRYPIPNICCAMTRPVIMSCPGDLSGDGELP